MLDEVAAGVGDVVLDAEVDANGLGTLLELWRAIDFNAEASEPPARTLPLDVNLLDFVAQIAVQYYRNCADLRQPQLFSLAVTFHNLEARLVIGERLEPTSPLESEPSDFPPVSLQLGEGAEVRVELVQHHLQDL